MTFDLSPEQQAAREAAQSFARDRLAPVAATIDESGILSSELVRDLQAIVGRWRHDAVALVGVVEELAAVSGAAAAASALASEATDAPSTLAGLRGFVAPQASDLHGRLVMAAVALGIGRAAVNTALEALRESARRSQDQEKPHWAVADAATEVTAALALTLHAAQAMSDEAEAAGAVAMAKLAASKAAQQAVDTAVRVVGPDGFARGTVLERLSRDVRVASLLFGTEEDLRATAAAAVLPG